MWGTCLAFFQAVLLLGYVYAHVLTTRAPARWQALLHVAALLGACFLLSLNATIDQSKTWFNVDAGFERAGTQQPVAFQKRSFPFRVDGVCGTSLSLVNMNVMRNFDLGNRKQLQVRLDVQNLFDAVLWDNPDLNPASTNFGKITGATNSIMRFFTFMARVSF